jgi:hypothetical protein
MLHFNPLPAARDQAVKVGQEKSRGVSRLNQTGPNDMGRLVGSVAQVSFEQATKPKLRRDLVTICNLGGHSRESHRGVFEFE